MDYNEYYKLFNEYCSTLCVSNDWLKKPMFSVFVGQLLAGSKVFIGGKGYSLREHLFMIQGSRTGGGELLKAVNSLFVYFGLNDRSPEDPYPFLSTYLSSAITPQALVGGIEKTWKRDKESKRPIEVSFNKKGMLLGYKFIAWGEGRNVISNDSRYGDFQTLLLNVLDEPGSFTYTARSHLDNDGRMPIYPTNTSIATKTILVKQLDTRLFMSGLLQRMLLSYREFSLDDYVNLRNEIDELKKNPRTTDMAKYHRELYKIFKEKNPVKAIHFNPEAIEKFKEYKNKIYAPYYKEFDKGDRLEIMQGFITANDLHQTKIAGQIAIWDNSPQIELEHLKQAIDISKDTIESIANLIGREFNPDKGQVEIKRQDTILKIIKKDGSVSRISLLKILKDLKKEGKWDLGYNKNLELLKSLEKEKIIECNSDGNCHIYTTYKNTDLEES